MKTDKTQRCLALLFNAVAMTMMSGCGRSGTVNQHTGPKVEVVSRSENPVEGNPDALLVTFVLANQGDKELKLGETSSSCGCSKATVTPTDVPPGGKAVLSVTGHRPATGSTPVSITLATNDTDLPTLTLRLELTGNPDPPKLLTPPPSVELGILRSGRAIASRTFGFDALEQRETPPLVQSTKFDAGFCRVEGGMVGEIPVTDPRFVTRSYRYSVNFLLIPDEGELASQIDLIRSSDETKPWLTVPIRGRVLPIVRAVPASISLAQPKGGGTPVKMMIICEDQSGAIDVACIDHDPRMNVRVVRRQANRIFYEIDHAEMGDDNNIRPLRFRVSQPVTTTLDVPVRTIGLR